MPKGVAPRGAPGHRDTTPDGLRRAERRAAALRLRLDGLTIRQVADRLGVDQATVRRDLADAATATQEETERLAAELRQLQAAEYRSLVEAWLPVATHVDDKRAARAADVAMRAMSQEAQLHGLNLQANRTEIQGNVTLTVAQLDAMRAIGEAAVTNPELEARLEGLMDQVVDFEERQQRKLLLMPGEDTAA